MTPDTEALCWEISEDMKATRKGKDSAFTQMAQALLGIQAFYEQAQVC